eukprot:1812934-Pyramimonas_sp.AAC.1
MGGSRCRRNNTETTYGTNEHTSGIFPLPCCDWLPSQVCSPSLAAIGCGGRRDSKLTRLLRSALGGNSRSAAICTVNIADEHVEETRRTLQFAEHVLMCAICTVNIADEHVEETRRTRDRSNYPSLGRENTPVAGTNRGRGERICP